LTELCQLRDDVLEEFQSLVTFDSADSMHADLLSRSEITNRRTELLLKYWDVSNQILVIMRQEISVLPR